MNKKFTVTYTKTVNLGNYESEKIELTMEYDREGIHPVEAYDEVKHYVESMINRGSRE